ncbi:HAMP domain-containing sensor histidine kinase [Halalkalibacter hemicellulosilyticus]|uniref:Sensor histidine kinase n=1 Tax=Halalkalibacter hemicellulosilyticusJCM 9152 TaxID=1236971 RepID=W4QFG5_9BACI|nr:sensor histidine kinase [Halalkalibacter hemicellulosilyticus]GAE30383.1 sensor histidine kinase LiaS [Halalkalibacter hemicellulosilyticusJCM 9152]
MRKRLARIQWQFIRHNLVAMFLISFFLIFMITYESSRGFLLLIDYSLAGIPVLALCIVVIIMTGIVSGYLQALPMRRRMDQLVHAAAKYERGTFAYRTEISGEDEVSELADRMNRMAAHIEEQVASLQRLSAERARMQDSVKKAAVTEERQRLARELHDAVSQQLFAISMMTAAIKQSLEEREDSSVEQVKVVEKMANTAQAEMRALLLHLRPAHLEGKSLHEGVEQLLTELKQKYQIRIQVKIADDLSMPKGIEDQLFRMVQEAISNVLRHAKASLLEFDLKQTDKEVKLKLIDNGVGFSEKAVQQSSYGLQTMKERMNEIGGTLHIVSVPSKGTQIEANIPVTWRDEQ